MKKTANTASVVRLFDQYNTAAQKQGVVKTKTVKTFRWQRSIQVKLNGITF